MMRATVETKLADTAAWPRMRPPMMPTVWPTAPGTRMPASLTSWNTSSRKIISAPMGKNTSFREAMTVERMSLDNNPW